MKDQNDPLLYNVSTTKGGSVTRDFFFYESKPHRPLINRLNCLFSWKYLQNQRTPWSAESNKKNARKLRPCLEHCTEAESALTDRVPDKKFLHS